jgi:TRAP-type mannitol/chloroaromatic compound transport system permease small subunit
MEQMLKEISESVAAYIPNLIGALAILIIGWIIALVLSAVVRSVFKRTKLDTKLANWAAVKEGQEAPDVAKGIGKVTFWLTMILVLVAFFEALRLTLVTDPFNRLMNQVFQFFPQLFGAVLLLLIAWVVASSIRVLITRAMDAAGIEERIGTQAGVEGAKRVPLTKTIGDVVYWLIFLLFLPAVLGALNLEGLLEPVQGMLDKFLGFLPNLFAAALIGVIGWFVARIVRQIVTSLLAAVGSDRLSDRVGLAPLSKLVGLIVYILILIPVTIAALNALALEAITVPASSMLDLILEAIPAIFAAGVVLTIAYVVGKVVAGLITDLLKGIGFNAILMRLGIGKEPEEGKRTPSEIAGYLSLVAIMLFAVFEASDLLGFEALSNMIAELTVLGGHILLGLIIFGIGLYLANLAATTIQASGAAQAGLLALVARVAIIILAGSIAIRHMGLANEIINLAFGVILGATALAGAIAFGIGGRDIAARKLEEWIGSEKSE